MSEIAAITAAQNTVYILREKFENYRYESNADKHFILLYADGIQHVSVNILNKKLLWILNVQA